MPDYGTSRRDPHGKRRRPRGFGPQWVRSRAYVHWVWMKQHRDTISYPFAALEHLERGWVLDLHLGHDRHQQCYAQTPKELLAEFIAWRLEHGI